MNATKSVALPSSASSSAASQSYDLQSCMLKSRRAAKLTAPALLTEFAATLAHDRGTTVELLIQMGEIEARKLYLPCSCSDMFTYCTSVMHMSESTAARRVRAARAARRFPVLLPMVADGRLHLSAVSLLAAHLTPGNAAELLAEATHRSNSEVELIVARRFPKGDVPECVLPLGSPQAPASPTAQVVANIAAQLSPVTVIPTLSAKPAPSTEPLLRATDESLAVQQVVAQALGEAAAKCGAESLPQPMLAALADSLAEVIVNAAAAVTPDTTTQGESRARITPRSEGRFAWQLTADQEMQDLLEQAQQLIGHAGPRDLRAVLKRGLEMLVETLRKARYAVTSQPRETPANTNGRHVPRAVVRAVAERDGHQCTFVGPDGRRCAERSDLQFDHKLPFARGGRTTVDNLRLLCPPHNQHEAERILGVEHMLELRAASRARSEQARTARTEAEVRARGKHVSGRNSADSLDAGERTRGGP